MRYEEFASKISFFEFIQKEFQEQNFNCQKYKEEFEALKNEKLTIESLTKILETNSKVIDIFEELFQLNRFTNTQLINFCFDVNLLNNLNHNLIISHIEKSILFFENGIENKYFTEIFNKSTSKNETEIIFNLKRSIVEYIDKLLKKREILYNHIKNSISSRLRISRYLIENMAADQYLERIDIKSLLSLKRKPVDTKNIHGKFGVIKIEKVLKEMNFISLNNEIKNKEIEPSFILPAEFQNKLCYLMERKIKGIIKTKNKKPKIFDFILFNKGKIEFLIETNFYSTSGTKIGINEDEYIDLRDEVENFNNLNNTNFKFIWITDGNFWLTYEGEKKYNNLKNYFKEEYELLNYNLFREYLKKFL